MSKRTLILIVALLGVTAVLLVAALAPWKGKESTPEKVAESVPASAKTVLSIDAVPVETAAKDGTYTANINISTGENRITGVQFELSFDASRITDMEIAPGTFFSETTQLIKKIDNAKGTVSYALATPGTQNGTSGDGTIAVLTFKEIGNVGEFAQIIFLPKTQISSSDTDKPLLKSATGTTFRIENPSPKTPSAGTATQAPSTAQ